MSFSSEVKEELAARVGGGRHCKLAELAAILGCVGRLQITGGDVHIGMEAAGAMPREKYRLLLSQLFQIQEPEGGLYGADALKVLESVKLWDERTGSFRGMTAADGLLIQQPCCKRAFLRGAFLASGSMSDPRRAYHFEIVLRTEPLAMQLLDAMGSFDVDAKVVERKGNHVAYVKEGTHIVDLLNVMEAHSALLNLENIRIVKEMRNSVNRRVNCETANISKTVGAAVRQMEDILYIRDKKGLESLPDNLREVALLRLEYPDASLKELGTYLSPPVGKSGVNHRLRRISEIAAEMGAKHE